MTAGGLLVALIATLAIGQFRNGGSSNGNRRGWSRSQRNELWRPRPIPSRSEFPTWDLKEEHKHDVFTFVRVEYDSYGPFGWWDRWDNDYPDGDWNFSQRLRELTVHHKDYDHTNNPPDGSNWELLCLYCHDNEHEREHAADAVTGDSSSAERKTSGLHQPFAGLADLLKKKEA